MVNRRDSEGLLLERMIPHTPAVRADVNLKPGERILIINEQRISETTNVWQLLSGTVDEKTRLLVRAPDGTERTVMLRPMSPAEFRRACYDDWVKRYRKWVEEQSAGTLGYVHIQGMGDTWTRLVHH